MFTVLEFNNSMLRHMVDSCSGVVTKVKLGDNIAWLQNKPSFLKFFFLLLTVCQNILEVENEVQYLKRRNLNPK